MMQTPRIVHGVPGPGGEIGVLLLVPRTEALDWDLRDEVATTARYWMAERGAWWVASPYAATAVAIATRLNGGVRPMEEVAGEGAGSGSTAEAPRRGPVAALKRLVMRCLRRFRWRPRGGGPR